MSGNARILEPVPEALLERLGMKGIVVYAIPDRLCDLLSAELSDSLGATAVEDLRFIARLAHERNVDLFRNGEPVQYQFLCESRTELTSEFLRKAGARSAAAVAAQANEANATSFRYSRAYLGWLVSQEEYWSDLDRLIHGESEEESQLSAPKPAILSCDQLHTAGPDQGALIEKYKVFFGKWRLQTLQTLDLPVPLAPQLAEKSVYNPEMPEGMVSPVIPDIFPIDGEGRVSAALESARQSFNAPHLNSWKEIISSSSREKKRVDTYGRQFVLQHFWRVLKRQSAKLRKGLLDEVFAAYFGISTDMIRSDRRALGDLLDRPLANR